MSRRIAATMVLLVVLSKAGAADAAVTERILIPVVIAGELLGAHGSRWVSRITVTNVSVAGVAIDGIETLCRIPECQPAVIGPNSSIRPTILNVLPGTPAGMLLVDEGREDDLAARVEVYDISRASLDTGIEVPAVRLSDSFTEHVDLLDVAVDHGSRSILRVYDLQPGDASFVSVEAFDAEDVPKYAESSTADRAVATMTFGMVVPPAGLDLPGYTEIRLNEFLNPGRFRLRVQVVDAGSIWAFVSTTDNESQRVIAVTPARSSR